MKLYQFTGHLTPTPPGMLPMQMSGPVYLASEVRSEILKLAADLVRGNLLPAIETDTWCKTTPLAERSRIARAMDDAHERHKELAMRLKRLTESENERQ